MNDADDIDIYEEFGYVDLTKECEKVSGVDTVLAL